MSDLVISADRFKLTLHTLAQLPMPISSLKQKDCCKKKKIYTSEISLKSKGINSRYLPERHRLYVPLVSTITMCDMLPKHKVSENGTASNLQKEVLKVVERCPYLGLVTVMSISFTLNV